MNSGRLRERADDCMRPSNLEASALGAPTPLPGIDTTSASSRAEPGKSPPVRQVAPNPRRDILRTRKGAVVVERRKASDFDPELLDLFDRYVHGGISRRELLEGAGKFAVVSLTAAAILESLSPNYVWAQQVLTRPPPPWPGSALSISSIRRCAEVGTRRHRTAFTCDAAERKPPVAIREAATSFTAWRPAAGGRSSKGAVSSSRPSH